MDGFRWAVGVCFAAVFGGGLIGSMVGYWRGWRACRGFDERQIKAGSYRIGRVTYMVSGASFEPGPLQPPAPWPRPETSAAWPGRVTAIDFPPDRRCAAIYSMEPDDAETV